MLYKYTPKENTQTDQFVIKFQVGAGDSIEFTVNVEIKAMRDDKLRWELQTLGATGLSDTGNQESPDVVGKTMPDFRFTLDMRFREEPVGETWDANAHLGFKVGLVSRPVAVDLQEVGTEPTEDADTLTYQRAFSFQGEGTYNLTYSDDHVGAYVELGGFVRAGFDAFISEDRLVEEKVGDKILTFVNLGRPNGEQGFFQVESGFSFIVKQFNPANSLDRNYADLLVVEALLQKNEALENLTANSSNDTRNRWAVRFMATPEIPNSRKTKFLIGLEVSRALSNAGPQDIRVFYGANFSLKDLIGLRK